jgi:hypothetical protein
VKLLDPMSTITFLMAVITLSGMTTWGRFYESDSTLIYGQHIIGLISKHDKYGFLVTLDTIFLAVRFSG